MDEALLSAWLPSAPTMEPDRLDRGVLQNIKPGAAGRTELRLYRCATVPVLEKHVCQGLVTRLVKALDSRLGSRVLTT